MSAGFSSHSGHDASLLADNFQELHDIFWKAPVGIYKSTPEGRFLSANPAWAEMCGYDSPQDLIDSISDIKTQLYADPQDRESFKQCLEENGQAVDYEFRLRRPDGSVLWVAENVRAVHDERGNITHYHGIAVDISKRKNAEHEVQASGERFAKVFRSSPSPQAITDISTGTFLDVNARWAEIFGWSKDEIIGTTSFEFGNWEDYNVRERIVSKLQTHGHFKDEPIVLRTKQGRRIEVLWSAEKITFDDRQVMLSMLYDQTEFRQAEALCRQKNEEQAILLDCIPTQLWYLHDLDTYGAVNQVRADFLGQSKEQVQFKPMAQILRAEEAEFCRQSNLRVYATRTPYAIERWAYKAQGELRLLSITKTPKLDGDGNVEYVVCSATDITEKRQAELDLQRREKWFRHILSVSPVIKYTLDPETLAVTWVSPNIHRQLGYTQDEILKPDWWQDHIHAQDREQALRNSSKIFTQEEIVHEYRFIKKDGSVLWVQDNLRLIKDDQARPQEIVGSWTDITDRKGYEQQLRYLSFHDQLTGLYNRAYLENELERLNKSREYPIVIICMDLDGLKLVNDSMGHQYGDHQLKACGQILQRSFRGADIVARAGGDEFTALLPTTDPDDGEQIANRIREQVDAYNREHAVKIPLSLSIGLACADQESQNLDYAFKRAEDLMYQDKLSRDLNSRSQIMKALMAALEERDFITSGHAHRLENLSLQLGRKVHLSSARLSALKLLAQVHDLGKVGIPDHILFKPGPPER
ncbi:PAS domain S-box protein [Desulfovermiculus halophilus]|jgi:diguanylate cyclase (GGDEF)-like protein/PAS domain S-box-containing protein|uniref:PAS domain S-box protein n=1 Tax=Desulfovermiculus halophilus TaxID=339722 RepID=UPI0009FC2B17|nr:sensor domain-containing diguanylate cyclase [Desulfovermiculus halophilus]